MEVLFRCQTFRDVVDGAKEATESTIVQRFVDVEIACADTTALSKKL